MHSANAVASEFGEDSEEENILSRLFAMLIASTFVLSAFVGIVPAAQAAANALNVSDILKAFDAQGIPLSDGTRAHTDLLAMNPNTPVVAILKLSGDPVAVVKSQMPDMQLSAAQKDAIKAELKARQDALIPTIESLGGRVVGQYQVAYNGIAIQIPRSRGCSDPPRSQTTLQGERTASNDENHRTGGSDPQRAPSTSRPPFPSNYRF